MSVNTLRWLYRFVIALQHVSGVTAAYVMVTLLSEGYVVAAVICLACVLAAAREKLPAPPTDD